MTDIVKLSEYSEWLRGLKQQIKTGQIKAALAVNSQMIMLYWDLGRQITEKQEKNLWGSGFIEQLSKDLREEFPDMTGFSVTNLNYCKRFYKFYFQNENKNFSPISICPQLGGELQNAGCEQNTINPQVGGEFETSKISLIPWGHQKLLIDKCASIEQAFFYIHKTIENNWSRAVLEYQIETNLYDRQGKAITNFKMTLPAPHSDLAHELMKDPYNFDFLCLSEKVKETDLEKALIQHISRFLPELGIGFAYMGRQFSFKVGEKEYRTDLLFYHTRLKCYIVIELKTKEFEPEFVGKLNFYITVINEIIKDEHDKPTIGMLLCKNKDNYEVEFSLKDIHNPIGVSTFHYTELASDIKEALPSAEKLQHELLNFERKHEVKE